MNVFGIGLPEMAVIAVIGLLVFGPKRLPELGKTLGRTLRGFQSASQEFEREFRSAIAVDGDADQAAAHSPVESVDSPAVPVAMAAAASEPVQITAAVAPNPGAPAADGGADPESGAHA